MILSRKLTRYIILLFLLCFCGCASVNDRIKQVERIGVEKIYDYPYKAVFYACEDAMPRMSWTILESNFDKGYVFAGATGEYDISSAGIRITAIEENKTLVKILEFHSIVKTTYRIFFDHVDALLTRDQ